MTGASGVLMGDSIVDYEGDQADASRSYVELLQRYTGKPLGKKYDWGKSAY